MLFILYIFLFLIGMAAGSFLNVIAFRYQPGGKLLTKDIFVGQSRCRYCGKILQWYELIPLISFLIQKGKCRSCRGIISFQYPLIELLSGLVFLFFPLYFYRYFNIARLVAVAQPINWYYWFLGIWLIAALVLILISLIDFRFKIIPDQLNVFLIFLAIVLMVNLPNHISFLGRYAVLLGLPKNIFFNHLLAGGLGLIFFGAIILITRNRGMGLGDLKFSGALGLLMGWPDAFLSFLLSFIIGAAWSLGLIISKKKSFKEAVPFGPFLSAGVLTTVFFGEKILNLYFQLFNL